jgi:hypothetical protein
MMVLHNDIGDHVMQKKKRRPFTTCRFGISHHRGLECVAVMKWRARGNAGWNCTPTEARELVAAAPRCLGVHGTDADMIVLHAFSKAAADGVSPAELFKP